MAGQTLAIEMDKGDQAKLQKLLAAVSKGVMTMDGFFDAAEMYMIDSLTMNFEQGGRPRPWSPLSPVTIEMKGSAGILQDTGSLKNSINAQNSDRKKLSLELWAGEKHGLFHQDPDEDPMRQWGMVNANGMPFRPFILFQDEDIKELEKILGKWIDDVMK